MARDLDRIDRRLLAMLQRNNRRPLRDLAADAAISAPTCLRRIRRLEAEGVIRGHAVRVDARRAGYGVSAYIEVSLTNPSGAAMRAFERRMSRLPEVLECAEIAGDVDYLLRIVASDMNAFGEFTRAHFADDRQVRAYRSLLVLRNVKEDAIVPT